MSRADALSRWALLMDETVAETFAGMLGLGCVPSPAHDAPPPRISAQIEFSGAVRGTLIVTLPAGDAVKLAELLLAGAVDAAMAADTVGELCNMLAGGWKRRLKPPASGAGLSVPAIAHDESKPPSGIHQAYDCEGTRLVVRLTIEHLEEKK